VLTQYLTRTAQLLQNPAAPQTLYNDNDLTGYINEARGLLAASAECIRSAGQLSIVQGQIAYNFTGITPMPNVTGVGATLQVRNLWQTLGNGGYHFISPRPYAWFALYETNNPAIQSQQGPPVSWSQYAQGVNGSLYISPAPDQAYLLIADGVYLPVDLATDATPEAIPKLWTDAVPFMAAWFALMASQTGARSGEADKMLQRYQEISEIARRGATPDILPDIWEQTTSPVRQNQLGLPANRRQQAQGGG
jgi:hypothetical protein